MILWQKVSALDLQNLHNRFNSEQSLSIVQLYYLLLLLQLNSQRFIVNFIVLIVVIKYIINYNNVMLVRYPSISIISR